jgi:hypothetical protein
MNPKFVCCVSVSLRKAPRSEYRLVAVYADGVVNGNDAVGVRLEGPCSRARECMSGDRVCMIECVLFVAKSMQVVVMVVREPLFLSLTIWGLGPLYESSRLILCAYRWPSVLNDDRMKRLSLYPAVIVTIDERTK